MTRRTKHPNIFWPWHCPPFSKPRNFVSQFNYARLATTYRLALLLSRRIFQKKSRLNRTVFVFLRAFRRVNAGASDARPCSSCFNTVARLVAAYAGGFAAAIVRAVATIGRGRVTARNYHVLFTKLAFSSNIFLFSNIPCAATASSAPSAVAATGQHLYSAGFALSAMARNPANRQAFGMVSCELQRRATFADAPSASFLVFSGTRQIITAIYANNHNETRTKYR